VSPDGRTVAYLRGSTVDASVSLQFLDVRSNSLGPAISTAETLDYWVGLAWRPDSTAVAAVLGTERLHVWDRVSGNQIEEHQVPGERLTTVAFSGDGSRLLVGTRDGWVKSIAGTSSRPGAPVRVSASSPVTTLAVDGPGGRAVATTADGVRVLDLNAGTVSRTLAVDYATSAAAWILDGSAVVISGLDYSQGGAGVVSVYDATTWSRRSSATGRAVAGGNLLQLDAKGQRFLTASADRVALWDAQTGTLVRSLGVEDRTVGGFDPARSTLVLASTEATVSQWDPDSDAAITAACDIVGRPMTETEWRTYLPDRERREVC
jgi:WD40 repeat protein